MVKWGRVLHVYREEAAGMGTGSGVWRKWWAIQGLLQHCPSSSWPWLLLRREMLLRAACWQLGSPRHIKSASVMNIRSHAAGDGAPSSGPWEKNSFVYCRS
jgi:hypothetical protein